MTHNLKIDQYFADPVFYGQKNFEVRYNDRGYQRGDAVIFNVVDETGSGITHPLNGKRYVITYVLYGWGIKDNWCVFGIKSEEDMRKSLDDVI